MRHVSTAIGTEVLVSSRRCGAIVWPNSLIELYQVVLPYFESRYFSASTYAQQCYESNSTTQTCGTYVNKELPIKATRNAACPFPEGESICISGSSNLRLDTGLLNSHDHLGINTPPTTRFAFRYVHECAPLLVDKYARVNSSRPFNSANASLEFLYGEQIDGETAIDPATYRIPQPGKTDPKLSPNGDFRLKFADFPYVNNKFATPSFAGDSFFRPIPELVLDDAQITLYFLSADNVQFINEVDDEWYSAHQYAGTLHEFGNTSNSFSYYTFDRPVSVLGCALRYQACDPNTNLCSPLSVELMPNLTWSAKEQRQAFDYWMGAVRPQTFVPLGVVEALTISALQSRKGFSDCLQGPLPPDQWQRDVLYWQGVSLAALQIATVEVATGPTDASMYKYVQKTLPDQSGDLSCYSQKIRSTGYTSFNVLGLVTTLVVGGLIIIISALIELLCALIQRRYKKGTYRRLEWVTNETLQLQRMVHEELGLGTWTGASARLPVTELDERLGVLDITDERRPVVVRSPVSPVAEKPNSGFEQVQSPLSLQTTALDTPQGSRAVWDSPLKTNPEAQDTVQTASEGGKSNATADPDAEAKKTPEEMETSSPLVPPPSVKEDDIDKRNINNPSSPTSLAQASPTDQSSPEHTGPQY
ncbi:MAG: hypothetical protein Q9160_003388 [Pyrenula sp. 1 TL-2023]